MSAAEPLVDVGAAPAPVCRKALVFRARLGILMERMEKALGKLTTTMGRHHVSSGTEEHERAAGTS